MNIIIVSGRSGSGKSVALRVLEDLGYYCVDNLPVSLLPQLVTTLRTSVATVAVSLDVRNLPADAQQTADIIEGLRAEQQVTLLFLDTAPDILLRRYSETRRLHPLSHKEMPLTDAIAQEQALLSPIADHADLYIDTSNLTVHELSELVRQRIMGKRENNLVLVFESFGFKYGTPRDADYVFDVRFLPNPHWEPELRPLTGLDQPVIDFLAHQLLVNKFIWQIENLLKTWLPHLERNNRSYVTVAIGCTGGQHRSVYIAETLARHFGQERQVQIRHRELANHAHREKRADN